MPGTQHPPKAAEGPLCLEVAAAPGVAEEWGLGRDSASASAEAPS